MMQSNFNSNKWMKTLWNPELFPFPTIFRDYYFRQVQIPSFSPHLIHPEQKQVQTFVDWYRRYDNIVTKMRL